MLKNTITHSLQMMLPNKYLGQRKGSGRCQAHFHICTLPHHLFLWNYTKCSVLHTGSSWKQCTRTNYSHVSPKDSDTFWEICLQAILLLCEHQSIQYAHTPAWYSLVHNCTNPVQHVTVLNVVGTATLCKYLCI